MKSNRRKFIERIAAFMGALGLSSWPLSLSAKSTKSNMLLHQVYFWLKDPDNTEAHEKLKKGMQKMLTIQTIKSGHIGVPAATEPRDVVDHSFSYSFMVTFESIEDHDAYQKDPIHLEFIEKYGYLWSKVQVYDYNLI